MQDPAITLMAIFKSAWSLGGDLVKTNIRFNTGWFDSDDDKELQIVVLEDDSVSETWEIGYGTIKVTAMYKAEIHVHIQNLTGKGPGKAKDNRFKMVEEIRAIIKANETGLTDLWEIKLWGRGSPLDLLRNNPPKLQYTQRFTVTYVI